MRWKSVYFHDDVISFCVFACRQVLTHFCRIQCRMSHCLRADPQQATSHSAQWTLTDDIKRSDTVTSLRGKMEERAARREASRWSEDVAASGTMEEMMRLSDVTTSMMDRL